ncbi:aldehyde dehydrogenase, partial [Streptomyces sp. KLMMK]
MASDRTSPLGEIPPSHGAPPVLALKPGTAWAGAWRRCLAAAPEAFRDDDRVLNLWAGTWQPDGTPLPA